MTGTDLSFAKRLQEEVGDRASPDKRDKAKECESRGNERRFDDDGSDARVLVAMIVAGHSRQDRPTIVVQPSADGDSDDCAEGEGGGKERNDPVNV